MSRKNQLIFVLGSLLLAVGIFFRFYNIDLKKPWIDECITQVRISDFGYSAEDWQPMLKGEIVTIANLKQQLEQQPHQSFLYLLTEKLIQQPEHPPLYYLMARMVAGWSDNQIATLRSVSAYISLLAFPGIYWLCVELFGSFIFGMVGMGVIAVSPLYVLYAQEARQYSLWIVTILFCSAALIQTLKKNTQKSWALYSITSIIALYSHLFFLLVIAAQSLYVFLLQIYSKGKPLLQNYLGSLAFSIGIFLPWLSLLWFKSTKTNNQFQWFSENLSILKITRRFLGSIIRTFLDLGLDEKTTLLDSPTEFLLILTVLFFITYCLLYTLKLANRETKLFILTLILVPLLVIFGIELVSGKVLSQARYLIPVCVGLQLPIIYWMGQKIIKIPSLFLQKFSLERAVQLIAIMSFFAGGIFSCYSSSQATFWWNKGDAEDISQIAYMINSSENPLLISSISLQGLMTLGYQLKPTTSVLWVPLEEVAKIPPPQSNFQSIYWFEGGALSATWKKLKADHSGYTLNLIAEVQSSEVSLYQIKQDKIRK
ncbi:MAG: glycosyltransferase family 39 protein [Microcoleaceae cyanobacterium]